MKKISELADKFSMKLSLEPRPFVPSEDYQHTIEDIAPEYVPPDKLLSQRPKSDAMIYLEPIRGAIYDLTQSLNFGDFDKSLELIFDTRHNLELLSRHIKNKKYQSKSASGTLPYDTKFLDSQLEEMPDDEYKETIFQEVPQEKSLVVRPSITPPEHLPSILQEYLKQLDYMDRDQLKKEKKRLLYLVKQFAEDGHQPPFLLKKRIEKVNELLAMKARWF